MSQKRKRPKLHSLLKKKKKKKKKKTKNPIIKKKKKKKKHQHVLAHGIVNSWLKM